MTKLLMPGQVDRLLMYPRGRSIKLAKKNLIPHIKLPDGEIRFDESTLSELVESSKVRPEAKGGNHA
ncbi:MAG TPA: hypothetical protein VGG19_02980 [Tepidisphaeraceae bacterium]|jgi:hypothetical protein